MDINTVHARLRHEGISFLTITLPSFGKDFERGLDQGRVDRRLFQGFAWKAGLPRFLGGFLGLVFDRNSGLLLNEPDIDAIIAVRQLTLMFGKILLPCTKVRERKAMLNYIECEQEVRKYDTLRTLDDVEDFRRVSSLLFASAFSYVDRKVYVGDVMPKHGPGATADRLRGNGKYRQTTWPSRLEKVFPSGEFLLPSWSYYDHLESIELLEPGSEVPVKVTPVPKTLKTPRIIAMEPTAMQYAQQGLLQCFLEGIQQSRPFHKKGLLSWFLGFDDQTPNQRMARQGSLFGDLATLDLSDASDRVSNRLVLELFRNHPHLRSAVEACRSTKADVPGHGVMPLAKFASMGSALTFPIEAMVFLTLVFIGIERELNSQLSYNDIKSFVGRVRIYGDDIIIPVEYVQSVVSVLSSFGAKVNERKSFWDGKFRESCGKEYFNGEDVSIVRVRDLFPARRQQASRVISLVSLRNQLYWAGYWQTVKWLDGRIRRVLRYFPTVLPTSRVLGRQSVLGYETEKIDDKLHTPLVRGYVVSARIPRDPLGDAGALLKFFLKRGGQPSVDERHLERAGRPSVVDIKLRYASAV